MTYWSILLGWLTKPRYDRHYRQLNQDIHPSDDTKCGGGEHNFTTVLFHTTDTDESQ